MATAKASSSAKGSASKTGSPQSPPTTTAKKAPPKSEKRELIDTSNDARYVKRDVKCQFKASDDVKRLLAAGKSKKAKTTVPSGLGDQGDEKPKKAAAKKPGSEKATSK